MRCCQGGEVVDQSGRPEMRTKIPETLSLHFYFSLKSLRMIAICFRTLLDGRLRAHEVKWQLKPLRTTEFLTVKVKKAVTELRSSNQMPLTMLAVKL